MAVARWAGRGCGAEPSSGRRYDHFSVLCELLPVGIPSLAACLQLLLHGMSRPPLGLDCGPPSGEGWIRRWEAREDMQVGMGRVPRAEGAVQTQHSSHCRAPRPSLWAAAREQTTADKCGSFRPCPKLNGWGRSSGTGLRPQYRNHRGRLVPVVFPV